MMKTGRIYLLVLALSAAVFAFCAHAIVQITIFQLRLDILRRELLGYELASGLLGSRLENLMRARQDFDGEIRMSVLESSVLNAEPVPLEPGAIEYSGMLAVNLARFLNFKPPLRLDADAEHLLMLQYAFFMQRKKRYQAAIAAYEKIEAGGIGRGEDLAFVLLHGGYSHALAGNFGEAVARLQRVRREFAGTHFSRSAQVLLDFLLREGGAALVQAEDRSLAPEKRARAYFRAGRFRRVVELLAERAERLRPPDRLLLARALEESGRIAPAADQYRRLVEGGGDRKLRRQANRRLLLLGNFYAGGREVKRYAERQALALDDRQALRQIEKRRAYYDPPRIVARVGQDEGSVPAELLARLRRELTGHLPTEEIRPGAPATETARLESIEPAAADKPVAPEPSPAPAARPPLRIVLKDGREIPAQAVEFAGAELLLEGGTGLQRIDPGQVRTILGRNESAGVRMSLDGIPLSGVKLGFRDGNMLVVPP